MSCCLRLTAALRCLGGICGSCLGREDNDVAKEIVIRKCHIDSVDKVVFSMNRRLIRNIVCVFCFLYIDTVPVLCFNNRDEMCVLLAILRILFCRSKGNFD